MEQIPRPANDARPSSFAGLLASFASPKKSAAQNEETWSGEGLDDDVVTLSYEEALRNHARYRERGRSAATVAAAAEGAPPEIETGELACEDGQNGLPESVPSPAPVERDLRSASVTIRLSKAERSQLRLRAYEAGLTVSAYLRSCVLEADALRAQVKETLAELKNAAAARCVMPARKPWLRWFERRTKRPE